MKKLNAAQRFWLLFALAFLASTIALIVLRWPARDAAIVADLRAPECEIWRTDPQGALERRYHPENENECRALRTFIDHDKVTLRSVEEYDRYRLRVGLSSAVTFLAWWAAFVGSLYGLAWSSSKVISIFSQRAHRKDA